MGPKLLIAFGAGALATAAVVLVFTRSPQPASVHASAPIVTPSAQPAPVAPPVAEPAATPQVIATFPEHEAPPPPTPSVKTVAKKPLKPFTPEKEFQAVAAPPAQAPAPAAISLPEAVPEPVELAQAEPAPSPIPVDTSALPPLQHQTVTLTSGTLLHVRLAERIATDRNTSGDTFAATLDQPLVVDGYVIAEKGARVLGRIVNVVPAGRVQGVAEMSLELTSLTTADGQKIQLRTARFLRKGDTSHADDIVKVGAGAAIGSMIGAIAGGGKGAAIGAAAGGGAGTAAVLGTRGKAAVLETETRLSFKIEAPVTITER